MELSDFDTKFLGKNIIYYPTIDSTQKEIWRRRQNHNIKNGTIILSELQTAGMGTHGRKWHTDVENNIAFSFLVETNCNTDKIQGITVDVATTIIEVFKKLYNIELQIKDPNDIVYQNKKIGGILTETKVQKEKVKCIVIGIGINTNQENFAKEIEMIATSIKKEFGIRVENELVIYQFCKLFEEKLIKRGIIS